MRNYVPTLGRFLTPGPVFQAGDPNQMGGYTYSTAPAAQELPHADPNERIDPHGFTAVLDSIFTAPYHFTNCTFWPSGSSGHQDAARSWQRGCDGWLVSCDPPPMA